MAELLGEFLGCSLADSSSETSELPGGSGNDAPKQPDNSHRNESFLKTAWHKLTHQHDNLPPETSDAGTKVEDKSGDEDARKGTGSG